MDFNKAVVIAVGVSALIAVVTTMANWVPSQGEFERAIKANKKGDAEAKIRVIEREICDNPETNNLAYCMLMYSRYEALREREDYEE